MNSATYILLGLTVSQQYRSFKVAVSLSLAYPNFVPVCKHQCSYILFQVYDNFLGYDKFPHLKQSWMTQRVETIDQQLGTRDLLSCCNVIRYIHAFVIDQMSSRLTKIFIKLQHLFDCESELMLCLHIVKIA